MSFEDVQTAHNTDHEAAFFNRFSFALDPFQREAMDAISDNKSVVVCAPTGSGKTLIAEYAIFHALAAQKRVFYTTPLKALSNQKFYDLKQTHGDSQVGLLTGDLSINREAPIVVMTTEIFRNMLYAHHRDPSFLRNVGFVVLDECHYMNDAQRGTVWEESMIYCPAHIQLVALSATIANARELTDWMHHIHPTTCLIESDHRPVPLRFFYYDRKKLQPLFEGGQKLNRHLKSDHRGNRYAKKLQTLSNRNLVLEMHERDFLPAIFFIFSRAGCDKALKELRGLRLIGPQQAKLLAEKVDTFAAQTPFLANHPHLQYIREGFASHHAGLLPGLKGLVESLFQEGLIQVVFATETLAAGINMPARSTVISTLSKRSDDGHRLLNASEFLQMSGRAGRRGMDDMGYVVTVGSRFEGAPDAGRLASSNADPLNSQFTPTYGMVLNMLQYHTLEQAQELILKSFGQFTWERRMDPLVKQITYQQSLLDDANGILEGHQLSETDFEQLVKLRSLVHEDQRYLRTLKKQVQRYGDSPDLQAAIKATENNYAQRMATLREAPVDIFALLNRHKRLDEKMARARRHLKQMSHQYERERDRYWQQFLGLYKLLKSVGYIDDQDKPTAIGLLTAQIRAENPFLIAELLRCDLLAGLSPDTLAAVVCAISNDSQRDYYYSNLQVSGEVHHVFMAMASEIKRVRKLQQQYEIDVPVVFQPVASGLVEAWAQGLPWEQLIRATNIDEGDLVRMIRRTADLVRQFSQNKQMPADLAATAKASFKLLLRDPVKEIQPVALSDETDMPADEDLILP